MKIDAIYLRELNLPLVRPFQTSFGVTKDRRVVLAEIHSEGLIGWGECTAGEHPHFSEESVDSCWQVIAQELGPTLAGSAPENGGQVPRIFGLVRGNRMAKATLENAIWDLEAQRRGISLSQLLGGVRETIPCGVSIGIQGSIAELLDVIEREVAAGYQRIKLKCKPGWDVEVFERVRNRFPDITLSCDANSAYRLRDADHLATFDSFDLLMVEQPLWYDDFYYHSMLQKRLNTAICLDESIRSGIGRSHNIALSSLENFVLPGDVSASKRYWAEDIIEPEVTVSAQGEIAIAEAPGRGYEVRGDLVERLTVRKQEIRAHALVS